MRSTESHYTRDRMQSPLRAAALLSFLSLVACNDTPRVFGAPCGAGVACGGDLQCVLSSTFPDGYCSLECSTRECGEGAVCDRTGAPALCLAACESHDDCREGYQCWRDACRPGCDVDPATCGTASCSDGRCIGPECAIDAECPVPGHACVAGRCVDPTADGGTPQADGQPCGADAECASGICLPPDRGGVCTQPCTTPSSCIAIVEFDSTCAPVARWDGMASLCVPFDGLGAALGGACSVDGDCQSRTCASGQCTEPCLDAEACLSGQICGGVAWGGGTFTGCGYEPDGGLLEIDLGTHELEAGYPTSTLTFATPPGSVSVTLRAQVVSGDPLPISFVDVHDPRTDTIFDLETVYAWMDTPIRWLPYAPDEAIAMLVPNATAERVAYVPGRHDVRVLALSRTDGDTGRATVRVSALVKRAPGGTVSAGTLDLDVYLVGVGVSAAAAPTNTRVRAAIDRFAALMRTAGIDLGAVQYLDVSSADATRYQVIDSTDGPASELAGLFRLTAGRTGRLSVFFVRSINGGSSGFNTLGIAGGIPGPSGIPGTSQSGVVVTFDPTTDGSAAFGGFIMAHEVSHFLGLYHVTEQGRACGPGEDPSTGCAPFGGTDTIGDTARGDDTNLMNWSVVGSGTNDRLSAGQRFVLLRSALVR